MRKSERIRLLELQMVRFEMELELTKSLIAALLDIDNLPGSNLESGKWYKRTN
jgi:hypothetical protein